MLAFTKRVALVVLSFVIASQCHARKHDAWVEVKTPNFIVVSSAGEKEAKKVALQLEEIRVVFRESLRIANIHPTPTLIVLVVTDEDSMRELLPEYWAKGHAHPTGIFVNRLDQFYAALQSDAPGTNPYENLYHEYYHLLTAPYISNLPAWLTEGLAEYYGHTKIEEKRILMGEPDSRLLAVLKTQAPIPLKVLLKVDHSSPYYNEQDKASIFYAESWALTHYFMIGDRMAHKPMLESYLGARDQGRTDDEAYSAAFGDLTKLQSNLQSYILQTGFLTQVLQRSNSENDHFATRVLSEGETNAFLGGFAAVRGRMEDASSLLEQSVQLEPNLALAYQNLGLLDFFGGHRDKALQSVSKAIALDPKNYWTHYFRAYVATNGGSFNSPDAQVDEDLRQSIALKPDFPRPYGLLAVRLANLNHGDKELAEALSLARKAVSLEPGNSTSLLELAEVLSRMSRYDEAKVVALRAKLEASNSQERAIAETFLAYLQHPQSVSKVGSGADKADVNKNEIEELSKARAALKGADYEDAIHVLQHALESNSTSKEGWNLLGLAYLESHRTEDAIVAFNKQIDVYHESASAYNNLGRAYWIERKYEDAEKAFRKQLEVSPNDKGANAGLGGLYLESHKYDHAAVELEKATLLTPKDAHLLVNLGTAYLNLGQDGKAMAKFDEAVRLSATPRIWNEIAYQLSLKSSRLDLALQYAQLAVKSTSTSLYSVRLDQLSAADLLLVSSIASYWDTLGWVYNAKGDSENAKRYVSAAWALGQRSSVADHLGQIYGKLGEKDKAIAAYDLAFDIFRPADPQIRQRFATLLGSDEKVGNEWTKHRDDLSALRTVRLQASGVIDASADFFVLLAPSVGGTRVEGVKFIRGDERLKNIQDSLLKASYPVQFPEDTLIKIVRRGTLSCSTSGECSFAMTLPQETRTAE
jgi:tetratricopeptide (TPR) repeat protein